MKRTIPAALLFSPGAAFAFDNIRRGLETLTADFLIPLTGAVAGCAMVGYVIMSLFRMEEYQRKIFQVFVLSIVACGGLTMIETIFRIFR